jgi:hypothetical protein
MKNNDSYTVEIDRKFKGEFMDLDGEYDIGYTAIWEVTTWADRPESIELSEIINITKNKCFLYRTKRELNIVHDGIFNYELSEQDSAWEIVMERWEADKNE